jgi:hypothetical protein
LLTFWFFCLGQKQKNQNVFFCVAGNKNLPDALLPLTSCQSISLFVMTSRASLPLIQALRTTARRLATEAPYQWGHMGSCNCGHLAQTITRLTKAEIHTQAMQRYGDWERQLVDYCPTSGLPFDQTIDEMMALGFSREDLTNLEKLGDLAILAAIPFERRNTLRHNQRDDVVLYLRTWADLLEQRLLAALPLPGLPEVVGADAVLV